MAQGYSFEDYSKNGMARAIGKSMSISFKQSVEICSLLRDRKLNRAKQMLNDVIAEKSAVPFRRFRHNIGHKSVGGPARYPKKASAEILALINQVEANAQFKGLNTSNLVITHINANKASSAMRQGRKRGRKAKRTNIEIVVSERAERKDKAVKKQAEEKKADKK